jgi:hypothetical protein
MTDQSNTKLAKELDDILNELDASNLDDMTEEELLEYRKQLNSYGRTIQGSDKYLNFSCTNLTEEYTKKLVMTGMIGYLNAAVNEYKVPDGFKVIDVYDYCKNPSILEESTKDWTLTDKIKQEIEENKKWMEKRVIIKEFLEDMFQFNPDKHVRSAYKPQPKDLARGVIDTPAANLAVSHLKQKDAQFKEDMLVYDRAQKLINMDEKDTMIAAKKLVTNAHYGTIDYASWTPEDKNLIYTVTNMIPPADIFHKFKIYYETNYDKLREAVQYLYCDKPDYDLAINPYEWHDTLEDAEEFQKKHRGEVISDIMTAHSGKWNFFAPFAKVRENTKFFNDNTVVLEEIAKQIESDAKIGGELMKNRVKLQKQKNIEEEGEDSEFFKEWKNSNRTLKDMKAVTLTDTDLIQQNAPDNAIGVEVYRIGEKGFEKSHFYTKAVAPEEK